MCVGIHTHIYIYMVNGALLLLSLSDLSFSVHRNATDFCVFILYPATSLNSLVSASSSLVAF